MAQYQKRPDDDGLQLDLELRACVRCRRELLPWQTVCPDDGSEAVPKSDLPAATDPLLARHAHLLAEFADEDAADGDADR